MPKLKTKLVLSPQEEALVQQQIAADPDNPEMTDAQAAAGGQAEQILPTEIFHALKRRRGQRGPQKAPTKEHVSLRLPADTVAAFRSTGEGWRARMAEALAIAARRLAK